MSHKSDKEIQMSTTDEKIANVFNSHAKVEPSQEIHQDTVSCNVGHTVPSQSVSENVVVANEEPKLTMMEAIIDNSFAIDLAKKSLQDTKKQEKKADTMIQLADKNFKVDAEIVNTQIAEKDKNNKIKKQEIKNDLLKLKQEAKFLKREHSQKLQIQKLDHRKEKYGGLLERRKIDYLPNAFVLFLILCLDGFVSCLDAMSKVFGGINKTLLKAIWIIILFTFIFIAPAREWLLSLISGN